MAQQTDELALSFKLRRKEKKVKIEDEDGIERDYVLREVAGTDRDAFVNMVSGRMKGLPGGGQVMRDSGGIQADLIARSLFEVGSLGETRVSINTVVKWPASVIEALFREAQKISGLGKDMEEEGKND